MKKLRLPLGLHSFEDIRNNNFYYVDKTQLIKDLVIDEYTNKTFPAYYFLSRPRRFGKSTIVSTLQCLFEGKKDLFKGLYIYDKWQWSPNNIYPVIRLSFDSDELDTPTKIEDYVKWLLEEHVEKYQLSNINFSRSAAKVFGDVVSAAYKKFAKDVVVLIDEYDNPILEVLDNVKKAQANRNRLRGIYGIIKGKQEKIQFAFITGISLFSKINLFSRVNNLRDISLKCEYSSICGYTEKELKSIFADELKRFDFEEIRKWYDGYQWDKGLKSDKVFCPHSVLNLFDDKDGDFSNFWYESSIPYHVYKILKSRDLSAIELTDRWVDKSHLGRFEVEDVVIDSLLFQSGFLTIKDRDPSDNPTRYLLTYPNEEVKQSLSQELLRYLSKDKLPKLKTHGSEILKPLKELDADKLQKSIYKIFKEVPYYWHGSYNKDKQDGNNKTTKIKISKYECWYASLIYTMFVGHSVDIRLEKADSFGRSDMIVILDNKVFVMEFKLAEFVKDVESLTDEAIKQVKNRKYGVELIKGDRSCLYMVVMVFVQEERNINKVLIEKLKL